MLRHLCVYFFLSLPFFVCLAQEKATTQSGKKIIVYPNGTWELDNDEEEMTFGSLETHFRKPPRARSHLRSPGNSYEVWYDAGRWKSMKPKAINEDAEMAFQLKGEEGYAMLIFEKVEVPVENLMQIAFQNAQSVAADAKIYENVKRKVNGKEVHSMRIEGTLNNISFTYLSYYFSDPRGSIQFTTFTSTNLFKKYRPYFEQLLNGLVIL